MTERAYRLPRVAPLCPLILIYNPRMHRLSPRQVQTLATLICGGGDAPTAYRRAVDIDDFIAFTQAVVGASAHAGMSRFNTASAFIAAAQDVPTEGASGLGSEVEKIIKALVDAREFESTSQRDLAIVAVNQMLAGLPVRVGVSRDGNPETVSTVQSRSARVLDEQIHTVFSQVLSSQDLAAPRVHYEKARRYLDAAHPDHENAAKEAVSSLESLVKILTGETDYGRAIKKAEQAGLIPRPIDDIAVKLFAYRGNEPGVAHGSPTEPSVTAHEARLIFNLVGSLGGYLAAVLRVEPEAFPNESTERA